MAVIIESLVPTAPKYITTQEVAFEYHYRDGGLLWKRRDGQSEYYKKWALGVLPVSRLIIYELFMVDGRKPTKADIEDAENQCKRIW